MGFQLGRHGRMLGTNRAFNPLNRGGNVGEWQVVPTPADGFLLSSQIHQGNVQDFLGGGTYEYNHPGGASALGRHLVVPLDGWEYNGNGGNCDDTGLSICGTTQQVSEPYVQIINMANVVQPAISSLFLTHILP